MARRRPGRVKIGSVGVDAGMLWLGDPCYIDATNVTTDWDQFLKDIATPGKDYMETHATVMGTLPNGVTKFPAGVVVETGYGDGEYPVYATFKDGRIASVTIEFMED